MITDIDKKTIRETSEKYHVKRVFLFGSSLAQEKESRDIDIAVEDLLFALSKSVDVVDLSGASKFIRLIKKEGIVIYG